MMRLGRFGRASRVALEQAVCAELLESRRLLAAAFTNPPEVIPGTIEAENFALGGEGVAYHDTEAANLGGLYRTSDGVDIELAGDIEGGGYDVGWTHAGEWLAYSATVAATGKYDLAVRVAAPSAGAAFHVEVDGQNVSGSLMVPNTGGWQNYTTVGVGGISISAGAHTVKLVMDANDGDGFAGNYNWLRFTPSSDAPPLPPGITPFGGTPAVVPGIVQAENFDEGGPGVAYQDSDVGNDGGAYRQTDVDIQGTLDSGGGYNVGWTHAGEWLDYAINVTSSGNYDVGVRASDVGAGAAFHIEVDGTNVTGTESVPDTGGFQKFTTITKSAVPLTVGYHVVRLVMDENSVFGFAGNYNYLTFTASASGEAPFNGTPNLATAAIEAENFDSGGEGVAYHDTTLANEGGQYRPAEGVDIEQTTDAGGGYDVGWTHTGEWLKYTIQVPAAGMYIFDARVANVGTGARFHVEINGQNITGPLTMPDTGQFQTYQDVASRPIQLPAGTYAIKIVMDSESQYGFAGNFNWFRFTGDAPKNLLFFGNSFTVNNNLPSIVSAIAQADGHAQPVIFTQAVPGRTLTDQLNQLAADGSNNIIVNSLPAGQTWDDVIFQDYSTRPLNGPNIAAPGGDPGGFRQDASTLVQEVHDDSPNVKAVPIETWARGYDNTVLYPSSYSGPAAMQADLLANYTLATHDAAAIYGAGSASLARAGEAWRSLNWARSLYDGPDEYHPSVTGSLLTALTVFRSVYNETTSGIPASAMSAYLSANGLTPTDWAQLTAAADGA